MSRPQNDAGTRVEVVVIGGGQAGLAAAYYLRRFGLSYVVLDAEDAPGGAWQHMWPALRLFSPSDYSSLPGWMMPSWSGDGGYPPAAHVMDYLTRYEERYDLPVRRPVKVTRVTRHDDDPTGPLRVRTDQGDWFAGAVISATGTWSGPFAPVYPGGEYFSGRQLHTVQYRDPQPFTGQRVVVVGAGNSAAQILAEVSQVADTTWVTPRRPRFLPDDVDGRVLFDIATARRQRLDAGEEGGDGVAGFGDIVMVPPVREARERGVLRAEPMFDRLTPDGVGWPDRSLRADAVIWCTGFRPPLRHLAGLNLRDEVGVIATNGTRSLAEPRLHLLGYGDWTGPASATLVGVGRTARTAVQTIAGRLQR